MLNIVLAGKDPEGLAAFAAALKKEEGIRIVTALTTQEAWGILGNCKVDVVVMDEQLADVDSLAFVKELVQQQPLINCAMVSTLDSKDFHEMTEGLGVFMQLPVQPGAAEAGRMLQLLQTIGALMAK